MLSQGWSVLQTEIILCLALRLIHFRFTEWHVLILARMINDVWIIQDPLHPLYLLPLGTLLFLSINRTAENKRLSFLREQLLLPFLLGLFAPYAIWRQQISRDAPSSLQRYNLISREEGTIFHLPTLPFPGMSGVLFRGSNSEISSRCLQKLLNVPMLPIVNYFPFEPFILAASDMWT